MLLRSRLTLQRFQTTLAGIIEVLSACMLLCLIFENAQGDSITQQLDLWNKMNYSIGLASLVHVNCSWHMDTAPGHLKIQLVIWNWKNNFQVQSLIFRWHAAVVTINSPQISNNVYRNNTSFVSTHATVSNTWKCSRGIRSRSSWICGIKWITA